MGLLNSMSSEESNYLARYHAEGAYLLGTACHYYKLVSENDRPIKDSAKDPIREYESPILVDVIFESQDSKLRGKKVTLEHDESSTLVTIPKVDRSGNPITIVEYSKLEVITPNANYPSVYDISTVKIDSQNPVYWQCAVTPHRTVLDLDPNTEGVQDTLDGVMMTSNRYLNYKRSE